MKAARLYTRVYLARSKDRRETESVDDLSKITIDHFATSQTRFK
jgi:hypothetical protein